MTNTGIKYPIDGSSIRIKYMKNIIALEKNENFKEFIIYIMWAQVGQASRLPIVLMQGISIFLINT